jgi:hypothetical protein
VVLHGQSREEPLIAQQRIEQNGLAMNYQRAADGRQ